MTGKHMAIVLAVLIVAIGGTAGAGVAEDLGQKAPVVVAPQNIGAAPQSMPYVRSDSDWPRALEARSAALNRAYGLGTYAPVAGDGGFDWSDAGIGAAGGFGVALLLAGTIVLAQRGRGSKLAH